MTTTFAGITVSKVSLPYVPVGHPDFEWTPHGDVQRIWRREGWLPQHELQAQDQAKQATRKAKGETRGTYTINTH